MSDDNIERDMAIARELFNEVVGPALVGKKLGVGRALAAYLVANMIFNVRRRGGEVTPEQICRQIEVMCLRCGFDEVPLS